MSDTPYRTSPLEDIEKRLARLEHRVQKLEDWSRHVFEWAKAVGRRIRVEGMSWWRG